MTATRKSLALLLYLAVIGGLSAWTSAARACPFCAAVSLTFTEEINNSQVAVIAKLVHLPPKAEGDAAANSLEVPKAKFEIVRVLKGADVLDKQRELETVYFGDSPLGTKFLVMGIDPPAINWGTPIAITDRGEEYVMKAIELPKEGADRLAFFQDFLEDKDEMLGRDAYDEFAKTPYAGVIALKDRMKHDQLVEWVKSPQVAVSHRRLYLTMLGVCGKPEDLPMLEELIKSKDRQTKGALDALVAAYLTIKGPDGMALVEDLFLRNKEAEYTDTYATIMALRFHGTEEKVVPRERLLGGIRLMLDRPQLADLVIPDLARWEDWSVMDKLVTLFKNADEESSWVRVPVINYLRACPLPKAKESLDELAKLDPETVKRANSFFPFAGAAPAAAAAKTDPAATDAAAKEPAVKDAATKDTTVEKPKDAVDAKAPVDAKVAPPATGATDAKSEKAETPAKPGKPAAAAGAAVPRLESEPATAPRSTAGLAQPLAKDALAAPQPPASSLGVFGGLAGAAAVLSCAFWIILKGGQHAAG
jgi:hypothetical protein